MTQLIFRFEPNVLSRFAPIAQAWAPLWALAHTLKLQPVQPSTTVPLALYPLLAQPLLQPEAVVHFTPVEAYQPQPTAANILWLSTLPETVPEADGYWVTTPALAEALAAQVSPERVQVLPPVVDPAALTQAQTLTPELDTSGEQVILTVLSESQLPTLRPLLQSYLLSYAQGGPLWVLRLVTNGAEADAEAALAELLESEAQALGLTHLESLNMTSVVGPMERLAFLRLLYQADVVALIDHWQTALEAMALGKTLLLPDEHPVHAWASPGQIFNWSVVAPIPWSEALANQAQTPNWPQASQVLGPLQAALSGWVDAADLPARREQYRLQQEAKTAQARQGRKQKYSMFHSDYNPEEMAARRKWHQRYVEPFAQAPGDVVDIGCGSGIFLELLRDLRVPGFGIDPDADMVAVCQELSLQALPGDERLLATFAADSIGGIHASHVIEHIDGDRALSFIEHALRVLMPGGLLIIRTPNWRNQTVRHEGFWLDITHVRPYPLPLLKQVLEDAGFEIVAQGFEDFGWNDTYIFGRKPC